MSILLGIGLATFFRAVCEGDHCKIIAAPSAEELAQIYRFNGQCYKFDKNPVRCNHHKQILSFA